MRTKTIVKIAYLVLIANFYISCKKEGVGGKATITGYVKHHALPVPDAIVYIKYGASELPGTDPSNYDANIKADANAKYEIKDLRKGNYYLFSIGYDSAISQIVRGGIPVKIKSETGNSPTDIPVVE